MRRAIVALVVGLLVGAGVSVVWVPVAAVDGPLTNAMNLRVRTDANGYLLVTVATASGSDGPLTPFGNLRVRTDANGYLLTTVGSGGAALTAPVTVSANGIAAATTDGVILSNATDATAGVTVQMSPRTRWVGTAWDTAASQTVAFFAETLPATAATPTGQWKLGYSLDGAAATYPLTVSSVGQVTSLNGFNAAAGTITTASTSFFAIGARDIISSSADGTVNFRDSGGTVGIQINTGPAAPTVTSCGSGVVTSGSRNAAGQLTNANTSCTVTFGAPAWTNAPFCVASGLAATAGAINTTAASTTAVTFVGMNTGDGFQYVCLGRI